MGADKRLPKMPEKPTLIDFFKLRFASTNTCCRAPRMRSRPASREGHSGLPAARHRRRQLHPLRPRLLGRADDRALCRRGGQLGDPHAPGSALLSDSRRLKISGDVHPLFGADYEPEPYISRNTSAPNHKWYMTSRMITVNDIYSFDPNAKVDLDDFIDIIGRNFRSRRKASASTIARRTCGAR